MVLGLDDGGSKMLEVCVLGLFCLERLFLGFLVGQNSPILVMFRAVWRLL